MFYEMVTNKDFFGTEIRHPDDPAGKQILDEGKYALKQIEPLGISNIQKNLEQGKKDARSLVEPFVGITKAPADINMTKAEKKALEILKSKLPQGARTSQQFEKSKLKKKISNLLKSDPDQAKKIIDKSVAEKKVTRKEVLALGKDKNKSQLERWVKSFSVEEVKSVIEKANPEERKILEKIKKQKVINRLKRGYR
jgi:hypothetical protein